MNCPYCGKKQLEPVKGICNNCGRSFEVPKEEHIFLPDEPIFAYSSNAFIALGIFVAFDGLLLSGLALSTDPLTVMTGVLIFVASIGIYVTYRTYTFRVRSGRFFENSFTLQGRKFGKQYTYDEIDHVTLTSVNRWSNMVTIDIKGEEKSLVLYRNPKNHYLKTDLASWLKQKQSTI